MKGSTKLNGSKLGFSLLFAVGLVAEAGAADTFRQLKGPEVRAKFSGMEFTDDVHWALVFGRDGTLSSFEMGAAGKGTWRVEKDELCLNYSRQGRRCHEVWVSGKNVQLRRSGELPEDGVLQKPARREAH
jgi:hypothetical protein